MSLQRAHILVYFTTHYPYGLGESFIENELFYLAQHYQKVYVVSRYKGDSKRVLPANAELVTFAAPSSARKRKVLFARLGLMLRLLLAEALFSRQRRLFFNDLKNTFHYALNALCHADDIAQLNLPKEATYYSYWFFDWNLSLSVLKQKKRIQYSYTRVHGFDLYEDNGKPNYLPFRRFCLSHTDKVFTVSETGKNYLSERYAKFSKKIICLYLGTKDHGLNPAAFNDSDIQLVSCSNMIAVKRLELLVATLALCKAKIHWTHIGDGALQEKIKQLAAKLPSNIRCTFTGRISQEEIFRVYAEKPFDLFINCSISEGLPVSIMEASSFGIPAIATDVGGTHEVVTPVTGYLVPADFETKDVADLIDGIRQKPFDRLAIRQFWEMHFKADTNYQKLLAELTAGQDRTTQI